MPDDDSILFHQAMQGIKPMETETRVVPSGRRAVPVRKRQGFPDPPFPSSPSDFAGGSDEPWVLQANGLSHDRLQRLASGRMAPDYELDLHGMSRDESCRALQDIFTMAVQRGWRVLSIIHGRGLHSAAGRPVLRVATYDWLRHGPCSGMVLGVVPKCGSGGGSCLVLLRRMRNEQ